MNNNTQTNNDFSASFLIKDKSGQFKKVKDNKVIDYQPATKKNQKQQSAPIQKKLEPNVAISVDKEINPPKKSYSSNFKPESKPPLVSSRAAFIAEPDDEEEIRKHQEELDKILSETPENTVGIKSDSNVIIDTLISKFKLEFESEIYKKRFIKIIESRIKEVRSSIETAEVLHRAKKIGGLDLDGDISKNMVKELDNIKKNSPQINETIQKKDNITSVPKNDEANKQTMFGATPPAFIPIPSASAKPDPEQDKVVPKQKEIDKVESSSEKTVEVQKTEPVKKVEQPAEKSNYQQAREESVDKLYTKTPSEAMAKIAKARQVETDRPQVIDIRQPSAIIGPVEEIGELDLKEFRRMGENPSGSAEKVLEKIYLLEEDSWVERMKGLRAWQQSPIYKLYIEIGRASIDSSTPITQIISQRESAGKQNLHMEEFLAINNINNQLEI